MIDLKITAKRICNSVDIAHALKDHCDCFNILQSPDLYRDEPVFTGIDHVDAWMAAAAHYEASLLEMPEPTWCHDIKRCLDKPYFIGGAYMRMIALVETPFAFRQRLLFIGKTILRKKELN